MAKLISKKYVNSDIDTVYDITVSDTHTYFANDILVHNCSPLSDQGKQIMAIKKACKSCEVDWIPMTGTPIKSKPTDAFLPLMLVNGHTYTSFYAWRDTFCVLGNFKDVIGYKNIKLLKSMLQPNMLRRLKSEVLDLPPKMHHTVYVENTLYQKKLYECIRTHLVAERGNIKHSMNPLTSFIRLRQVNGSPEIVDEELNVNSEDYLAKNAKLQELLSLLDELTVDGDKVVIFSNWVEPLRTLYRYISKKYKVCCYTGTMSTEDREKHKSVFINNPDYKIMLGTVGALGTSHTLTVAHNVVFYDEPWNPSEIEQCEDRCHRAGTSQTVDIYTLVSQGTVDETVHKILSKKEGTASYIVDNKLDLNKHPELIDLLLK